MIVIRSQLDEICPVPECNTPQKLNAAHLDGLVQAIAESHRRALVNVCGRTASSAGAAFPLDRVEARVLVEPLRGRRTEGLRVDPMVHRVLHALLNRASCMERGRVREPTRVHIVPHQRRPVNGLHHQPLVAPNRYSSSMMISTTFGAIMFFLFFLLFLLLTERARVTQRLSGGLDGKG